MKYGLIVNFNTQNIGDDIQSYAMEKFLPRVDYLIEREHLDSFYTPTGEKVAALLGGWYLHKALNWPPSPFLKLLPVSYHITTVEAKKFLTFADYGSEWFKKIAPIGCRDEGSMREFKKLKIDSYVSGCFTLTIKPLDNVVKHGKIVLVDLSPDLIKFVKRRTNEEIVLISHDNKKLIMPEEVIAFAEKHKDEEELPTSHHPGISDHSYHGSHYQGNWGYRRAFIEGLLRFYQGASLVVTGRLHASLPSLALGTPVLMIKNEEDLRNYRFSTFVPLLNHTTPEDLFFRKYRFDFDNPLPNPAGYEKFAEKIRGLCADFINSCENAEPEPPINVKFWKDMNRRNIRLKRILRTVAPWAPERPDPKLQNPALYNF